MVPVQCPSCEKRLGLPEVQLGKKVRCPECKEVFVAEASESKPRTRSKPASGKNRMDEAIEPRRARRPADEEPPPDTRRRRRASEDDDEDFDDDRPRRRRREREKSNAGLFIGLGVGGAVVALAAVVGIVWMLQRSPVPVPDVAQNNPRPNAEVAPPELPRNDVAPAPPKQEEAVKPVEPPVKPAPPPEKAPEVPAKPVVIADQSGGRKVELLPANADWKGPIHPAPDSQLQPITIKLPALKEHEDAKNLAFSGAAPRAAVSYHRSFFGTTSRIALCDLVNGAVIGTLETKRPAFVEAVNDAGTHVLLRVENGRGKNQHLELWDLSVKEPVKELEFVPYDETKAFGPAGGIGMATFLDDKRLLTIGANAKVVVWELPTLTPLYHTFIQGGGSPAVSADRKLLGFTTGKELVLLDLEAGTVLAKQNAPASAFPNLRFSPDGKWLSLSAFGDRVYAWDVASGDLRREMNPKGVYNHAIWTSDKHMLIGGNIALDFDMQIRFWEYKGQRHVKFHGGLTWFLYQGRTFGAVKEAPVSLIGARVPHPPALLALEKAAADPDFLVLTEGTTVKLDVAGLPAGAERDGAVKALQGQLERNGCKVGPDGNISLIARVEPGKPREISYLELPPPKNKFGAGDPFKVDIPPGTEVKFAKAVEFFSRLEFSANGEKIWETSDNNIPTRIRLEPGETVQQFLDKRARPNYEFFHKVELPRRLVRTKGSGLLGGSKITEKGIE